MPLLTPPYCCSSFHSVSGDKKMPTSRPLYLPIIAQFGSLTVRVKSEYSPFPVHIADGDPTRGAIPAEDVGFRIAVEINYRRRRTIVQDHTTLSDGVYNRALSMS
jgi:hypothetical protein